MQFNFISTYKKPIILISIGVISIILLVFGFKSYGKDYVTKMIDTMIQQQMIEYYVSKEFNRVPKAPQKTVAQKRKKTVDKRPKK